MLCINPCDLQVLFVNNVFLDDLLDMSLDKHIA